MEKQITNFRGKQKNSDKWLYGKWLTNGVVVYSCMRKNYIVPFDFKEGVDEIEPFEVLEDSIGEMSDKKDKNNKFIYEGDIIKHYESEYDPHLTGYEDEDEIDWTERDTKAEFVARVGMAGSDFFFVYRGTFCSTFKDWFEDYIDDVFTNCEIIGNTTDNPHLINI